WALLYVAHFDSVVIARATMPSGDEVILATASIAWMETTTFRGAPLRPDELRALIQEGALFATRTIREGRVLRHADVRRAYAAETGATVMMRYRRGRLQFDLSCKARQAGHLDDAIRLYSSETGKTYRARLTGPGAAEWIETL
ncbi:MAG: flagella basal body P-ring formation protein FlgA, partial [Bacteroidetes bacterium]|nr:flagella basal body P-ring formation protein FlgA [Bacteroidota bacterium]